MIKRILAVFLTLVLMLSCVAMADEPVVDPAPVEQPVVEETPVEGNPTEPVVECTCGTETEEHTEECALYVAPVVPACTCGSETEEHTEECALYVAPAEPTAEEQVVAILDTLELPAYSELAGMEPEAQNAKMVEIYNEYKDEYAAIMAIIGEDKDLFELLGGKYEKFALLHNVCSTMSMTAAEPVYVAQIEGGSQYQTLAAAVDAANDNDTISLLDNITLADTIVIDKKLNLNLGGKKIDGSIGVLFKVYGYGTVCNGTINAGVDAFYVGEKDTDTYDNALLVLEEDLVVTAGDCCAVVYGGVFDTYADLTSIGSYATICGSGNSDKNDNTQIWVSGGKVTHASDIAIYHPQDGDLYINGGTVSGATAIYMKDGTLDVNGGNIIATGAKAGYTEDGDGAVATGDAIVTESNSGYGNPYVNINGGTIQSKNAAPVAGYKAASATEAPRDPLFSGSATIKVGTTNIMNPAVIKGENGSFTIAEGKASVSDGTDTTYYASLAAALAAAESGDIIELLNDVEIDAQITIPAGVIVKSADGGMKTITQSFARNTGAQPGAINLMGTLSGVKIQTADSVSGSTNLVYMWKESKVENCVLIANGASNVSRGIMAESGAKVTITGNSFSNVFHAAYINGKVTGSVTNNTVTNAEEGFALCDDADVTFSGNMTGDLPVNVAENDNVAGCANEDYNNSDNLSAANNGALIVNMILEASAKDGRWIADDSTYATFAGALAGAENGDTIELTGDVEWPEGATIADGVTIITNGFDIEGKPAGVTTTCDHDFVAYRYNNDASCTTDGTETASCKYGCGATHTRTALGSAKGHLFSEYVKDGNATCTTGGTETAYCMRSGCQAKVIKIVKDGALGHDMQLSEELSKPGTCIKPGIEVYVCSRCDVTESKFVMGDHNKVVVEGSDASCTVPGLTDGVYCDICQKVLEEQEVIPAKGHTEEILPAVEPTCNSVGWTEGMKCSVCGEILKAQVRIPMLEHVEENVAAVEPTYLKPGSTAGVKCSVCGNVLSGCEQIGVLTPKLAGLALMRKGASQEAGIYFPLLQPSQSFSIVGEKENNFYPIMLVNGTVGWLHASYVA